MKQLTKEQAIELAESLGWLTWTPGQIVRFQLFQDRLCMPFGIFTEAIEEVLGRPVYTHEFADIESIRNEYLTLKSAPTLEEIIELIPEEKRLIIKL